LHTLFKTLEKSMKPDRFLTAHLNSALTGAT